MNLNLLKTHQASSRQQEKPTPEARPISHASNWCPKDPNQAPKKTVEVTVTRNTIILKNVEKKERLVLTLCAEDIKKICEALREEKS